MEAHINWLKIARQRKGISQTELAKVLNVHPVSVNRWEHGVRTPSLFMIYKIASVMEMSVSELLNTNNVAIIK